MSFSPLILASGSPRRSQLLREWGYEFQVFVPEVIEIDDPTIPIRELTACNARLKADAVAALSSQPPINGQPRIKGPRIKGQTFYEKNVLAPSDGMILVAADTLVLLGDRVLTKPRDMTEAAEMLGALVGRTHQVFTAVTVLGLGKVSEFTITTEVTFLPLRAEEQKAYHLLIDPLDKAGAYAAQDHGEKIIAEMRGSFTNVMGLPMERLSEVLAEEFGIMANRA